MPGNVASQSEGSGLRPSPAWLVLGLLLFATTWTWAFIPSAMALAPRSGPLWAAVLYECLTYYSPGNMGGLYFLPGLVLALILFGCLHLWLRRRPNRRGWLGSACAVSLALAVLETALLLLFTCDGNIVSGWTRYTLGFVVGLAADLFVCGVLSAWCWTEPTRKGNS